MKILALEFSSKRRSIALLSGGDGGEAVLLAEALEVATRSTRALHAVEKVLQDAGVERAEVGRIAVGIGPGSYTGIRAAISLVQGWELALETTSVGVGSLEAVARRAFIKGVRGRFAVVIDAHRHEFYVATYDAGEVLKPVDGLELKSRKELESRRTSGEILLGPEMEGLIEGEQVVWPDAETVGRMGMAMKAGKGSETLEPVYLRETSFVKAPPARWG